MRGSFCGYTLQLPECLRIIGYLCRIGVFSEYEMRLQVNLKMLFVCNFFLWDGKNVDRGFLTCIVLPIKTFKLFVCFLW